MDQIFDVISTALRYLATIRVADIIDIAIVTFLVYKLFMMIRRSSSFKVARGLIVLVAAFALSSIFKLNMINFLMKSAVEIGLIAIVVIFQPELRRILEKVGTGRITALLSGGYSEFQMENVITQTVAACEDMSKSRTGTLIVFEGVNSLADVVRTGTVLDASVSSELLKNLFFVKAPMHDGAVIVRKGRIAAAGCMLPMSSNMNLSKELGMRHRAGIGITEQTDAVVVIVSEETGAISIAVDGMLKRHLSRDTMETLLRKELIPNSDISSRKSFFEKFKVKRNGK